MFSTKIFVCILHIAQILSKDLFNDQNILLSHPLSRCRHVIHLSPLVPAENCNTLIHSSKDGVTIISSKIQPERLLDQRATCLVHMITSSIDDAIASFGTVVHFRQDDRAEYELFIVLLTKPQIQFIHDSIVGLLAYMQKGISVWLQQAANGLEMDSQISINYKEMYRPQFHCNWAMFLCLSPFDATSEDKIMPKKLNYFGWPLYVSIPDHLVLSYNFQLLQLLPFWKLFAGFGLSDDFKMPTGKLCLDIAKYINATAAILTYENNDIVRPEYLSLIKPDTTLVGYAPSRRPLVTGMEKMNFMFCRRKGRAGGNLSHYLCPFESLTWLMICLAFAGTSLALKMSTGNWHIFNLISCLLLQSPEGNESLKKTWWVLWLWVFATLLITNLYTNFIESTLVVPIKISGPETFEQLYLANYRIVLPDSGKSFIDDLFRLENSPFGGTWYLNELRENAEYCQAPLGFGSPEFIDCAINSDKRAMVLEQNDVEIMNYAVRQYAPDAECKAGSDLITSQMLTWAGIGGHAAVLRSILHQLFVGGLIQFMTEGSHRSLEKQATLLSSYASLDGRFDDWSKRTSEISNGAVMENAQFRIIFLSWLSGLAGSAVVFLLEIPVGSHFCRRLLKKFQQKWERTLGNITDRKFTKRNEAIAFNTKKPETNTVSPAIAQESTIPTDLRARIRGSTAVKKKWIAATVAILRTLPKNN